LLSDFEGVDGSFGLCDSAEILVEDALGKGVEAEGEVESDVEVLGVALDEAFEDLFTFFKIAHLLVSLCNIILNLLIPPSFEVLLQTLLINDDGLLVTFPLNKQVSAIDHRVGHLGARIPQHLVDL